MVTKDASRSCPARSSLLWRCSRWLAAAPGVLGVGVETAAEVGG